MLNNEGKKVKKFARTRIRTPNLLIQSFFTIAIRPQLVASTPRDLAAAAIATV